MRREIAELHLQMSADNVAMKDTAGVVALLAM